MLAGLNTCMNRLARSRTKSTPSQATGLGMLPIGLAPKERARLFGGLEALVNTGDSLDDYQELSRHSPKFWPGDSKSAWNPQEHATFIKYRDQLRELWRGSLDEQKRMGAVAFLLGLITSEEVDYL